MKPRDYMNIISGLFFKNRLEEMTYFVTEKCNMDCPHCFNRLKNRNDEREELSADEIDRISFPKGRLTRLLFSGGEPFLRKDLADICIAFLKNTRILYLTIPTNGSLPEKIVDDTEKIAKMFPGSIVEIKISLDNTGEKRDAFTGFPGGSDRLVQTANMLGSLKVSLKNVRVGVITTVVPENQYDIDDIFRFAAGTLNVDDHSLSLARGFNGYDPELDLKYLAGCFKKIYGKAHVFFLKGLTRGIIEKIILYRNFLDIKYRFGDPEHIKCYSGRLRVVMDPYGNVYPCELKGYPFTDAGRSEWWMGNIRDTGYSFGGLLNGEKAFRIRKRITGTGCVCNHGCDMNINIIHDPDQIAKAVLFSGTGIDAYLDKKAGSHKKDGD